MGRIFNSTTTSSGGRIFRNASPTLPPASPSTNNLDKLLGVLSAGETGNAVYAALEGKNPLATYASDVGKGVTLHGMGGKKTYSDVLEKLGMGDAKIGPVSTRGTLGLALDILLDPTTYAGGAIVKGVSKPVKAVAKATTKIPVAGETITAASKAIEELLVPGAKLKRDGNLGKEYWEDYLKLTKGTRGKEMEFIGGLTEKMKALEKLGISREAILKAEKGLANVPEAEKAAITPITDLLKQMGKEETEKGLLTTNLENYLPHVLSDEGRKFVTQGKIDLLGITKPLREKLKAGKGRGLLGTIEEINQRTLKDHGIKLFEEDPFKIIAQRGVDSIRALEIHDFLKTTGAKFGIVNTDDAASKVVDGVRYIKSSSPSLSTVLLPEAVAQHLDQTYKFLSNDEAINGLLKAYDKVLNIWKGSVTGIFPAFHGRNALGGVFNNFLAGVKNPLRYTQADELASGKTGELILNGKKYAFDELRELMRKYGILGQPGLMDVMKSPQEMISGYKGLQKLGMLPRDTMEFIENRLRGALFIDRLAKGDDGWQAAKQVFKFHFDYAPEGLTTFESQIMKRIVPFYTWTRNNIPLQIEQAIKQPGKFAGIGKTIRAVRGNTQQQEQEYSALPSYIKEAVPIRMGETKKGSPNYLYSLGLPLEDVNKISSKAVLDLLSPVVKFPLERLTGKNFYFDKDISEVNTAPQMFSNLPQPLKEWLSYKESRYNGKVYRTADPYKLHFLTSLISRGIFTLDKLTDPNTPLLVKSLYTLSGIKGKTLDIEQEKVYRAKEQQEKTNQLLESQGKLKKFTRYYQP